jgi:hypothetical protein
MTRPDLRAASWRILVLTVALAAACSSVSAPPERVLVTLFDLEVPATVAPTDTARIGFTFDASCGPTPWAEISMRPDLVEVAVWREVPEFPYPCPAVVVPARREVSLLPGQRAATVTVRFRQPGGVDSVRTITETTP